MDPQFPTGCIGGPRAKPCTRRGDTTNPCASGPLSSHPLFTYADRLDPDFHLASLLELSRVSSGETRLYPLVDHSGARQDDLVTHLRTELHGKGIRSSLRETAYEFDHGATTVLVLHSHPNEM